jgi:hypothetical protein
MNLYHWAMRWQIPIAAVKELEQEIGCGLPQPISADLAGQSESAVLTRVRLEASKKGLRLWRNNVGALRDEKGNFVRFGLANESAAVNEVVKSGDLIGIRPLLITPGHIGMTIGQFVSRECKPPDWVFRGTDREMAQQAWALFVASMGGDAAFCTGEGTL